MKSGYLVSIHPRAQQQSSPFEPYKKEKSQPGTLTLGLGSSYLERVVIPSPRIPCDDSIAKVMLFP